MDKKQYVSPRAVVVYCEDQLLWEPSQWTDEYYGKPTTMKDEEDDWNEELEEDELGIPFKKNAFDRDIFDQDVLKD